MTRLISMLTIFICSCSYSKNKNNDTTTNDTNPVTRFVSKVDSLSLDTLRDPNHFYYLTDLPLRKVAQLILKDSIQPSDNKITFDCMDSVSSGNSNTRNFYFPVFLRIVDKADGALAEVVGQYTMKFVEEYPKEFADKSVGISEQQFQSLAAYTGNELYFTYDKVKNASKWTKAEIKKCSNCDTVEFKRLEQFYNLAVAAMKDTEEN